LTGAVSTAAIPASFGIVDWRILAGAAGAGAIAGLFGIPLANKIKSKLPVRKKVTP